MNYTCSAFLPVNSSWRDQGKGIRAKLPGNEEFIKILYRLYLNREADAEGLALWTAQLGNGASLDEIMNGFAGSSEFKAILNGMKKKQRDTDFRSW